MELPHGLGEVEDDLRHERPALDVAAPLQLEQVTLCPQDDVLVEALANPSHAADRSGPRGAATGQATRRTGRAVRSSTASSAVTTRGSRCDPAERRSSIAASAGVRAAE